MRSSGESLEALKRGWERAVALLWSALATRSNRGWDRVVALLWSRDALKPLTGRAISFKWDPNGSRVSERKFDPTTNLLSLP